MKNLLPLSLLVCTFAFAGAFSSELNALLQAEKWEKASEMGFDLLSKEWERADLKIQTATALFELELPYSSAYFIDRLDLKKHPEQASSLDALQRRLPPGARAKVGEKADSNREPTAGRKILFELISDYRAGRADKAWRSKALDLAEEREDYASLLASQLLMEFQIKAKDWEAADEARRLFEKSQTQWTALIFAARGEADFSKIPTPVSHTLGRNTQYQISEARLEGLTKEINRLERLGLEKRAYNFLHKKISELRAAENVQWHLVKGREVEKINADLKYLQVQQSLLNARVAWARAPESSLLSRATSALENLDSAANLTPETDPRWAYWRARLLWTIGTEKSLAAKEKPQMAEAQDFRWRALNAAERLLPLTSEKWPMRPSLHYFLGAAQKEMGKRTEAKKTLNRFLAEYPNATRRDWAMRLLGDLHFEESDFPRAKVFYETVTKNTASDQRGYAEFRLGWVSYRVSRYAEALAHFDAAFRWCDRLSKSESILNLETSARRSLLSVFAETGNIQEAPEYFNRFMANESHEWVQELAAKLDRRGDYEKSAVLYRYLIDRSPASDQTANYRTSLLWSLYQMRDWKNVENELAQLKQNHGELLAPPQTAEHPLGKLENTIREIITAHNQERKEQGRALIARQQTLTESYLHLFHRWPQSKPWWLEQSKILFDQREPALSAQRLQQFRTNFAGQLTPDQGEEALRRQIEAERVLEVQDPPSNKGLLGRAKVLSDLAEQYLRDYPNRSEARSIGTLRSSLFFKHGDIENGIASAQQVFDYNPRDAYAKQSFENLRVAFYQMKDWGRTFAWATEMWQRKFPGLESYRAPLSKIRAESLFLWAENTEDPVRSAQLFYSASEQPDMKDLWEKGLYNAFLRYQKAGRNIDALKTADQLDRKIPRSEKLLQLSGTRAALLQAAGRYREAYPHLLTFLRNQAAIKAPAQSVNDALFSAALVAEALGRPAEALKLAEQYLSVGKETNQRRAMEMTLRRQTKREVASIPAVAIQDKEAFLLQPLPTEGTPAQRVRSGARAMEALAKAFLKVAADETLSVNDAVEAHCVLPQLYSAFDKSLDSLIEIAGAELLREIEKLRFSLNQKAKELAQDCIKLSVEKEHDGPEFRKVNMKFGWEWDPIMSGRIETLARNLSAFLPRLDVATVAGDEDAITEKHLQNQATAESWYALALSRCQQPTPLCRLTISDSLARFPYDGKLLNLHAWFLEKAEKGVPIASHLAKASKHGSQVAESNLAYYHLRQGRMTLGLAALWEAENRQEWDQPERLKELTREWMKR